MKNFFHTRIGTTIVGWFRAVPSRSTRNNVGSEECLRHLDRMLDRRKATASVMSERSRSMGFGDFQLAQFKGAPTDAA
jgi:hypothetical protein